MKTLLQRFMQVLRSQPIWLLVLAAFLYGPLLPYLGLYWDDFPYLYFGHVLGWTQYARVFFDERPFLPVLYNLTAPLFKENVLAWQVASVTMRWACTLAAGWIARQLWPEKKRWIIAVTLLFLAYPGFSLTYVSTLFSRAYVLMLLFLLSVGWMLKAERSPSRFEVYTLLALASGALSLLGSEYYLGLEVSRPVMLWLVVAQVEVGTAARTRRVLLHWLPYLAGGAAFSIWRGLLVKSALYGTQVSAGWDLPGMLRTLAVTLSSNAWQGGLVAWVRTFALPASLQPSQLPARLTLAAILGGALLTAWIGWSFTRRDEERGPTGITWLVQPLLLGSIMLLSSSLPIWFAGLNFDLVFPFDRFTLPMILGSAIILASLLELLPWRPVRLVLLSLLVGLAAGWNFKVADSYRSEWHELTAFLQQLSWRVPGLQPGTLLVSYELPFKYYSDNSLTAVINWTYAPDYRGGDLPYAVDYLSVRGESVLGDATPGDAFHQEFRALTFRGNTSDVLVIEKTPTGCLRVLDPVYADLNAVQTADDRLRPWVDLSDLERILTGSGHPAQPIPQFFKRPEKREWCYYFEKADLARQRGDTGEILQLWDAAVQQGFTAHDPLEYQPFVEGLGLEGRIGEAVTLSREMESQNPSAWRSLCQIWGRIDAQAGINESDAGTVRELTAALGCAP